MTDANAKRRKAEYDEEKHVGADIDPGGKERHAMPLHDDVQAVLHRELIDIGLPNGVVELISDYAQAPFFRIRAILRGVDMSPRTYLTRALTSASCDEKQSKLVVGAAMRGGGGVKLYDISTGPQQEPCRDIMASKSNHNWALHVIGVIDDSAIIWDVGEQILGLFNFANHDIMWFHGPSHDAKDAPVYSRALNMLVYFSADTLYAIDCERLCAGWCSCIPLAHMPVANLTFIQNSCFWEPDGDLKPHETTARVLYMVRGDLRAHEGTILCRRNPSLTLREKRGTNPEVEFLERAVGDVMPSSMWWQMWPGLCTRSTPFAVDAQHMAPTKPGEFCRSTWMSLGLGSDAKPTSMDVDGVHTTVQVYRTKDRILYVQVFYDCLFVQLHTLRADGTVHVEVISKTFAHKAIPVEGSNGTLWIAYDPKQGETVLLELMHAHTVHFQPAESSSSSSLAGADAAGGRQRDISQ